MRDEMAITDSLTIEGLGSQTLAILQSEAARRGIAVAELARTLLQQSVSSSRSVNHTVDALAVTWTKEETAAFDAVAAGMRQTDGERWQ